MKRKYISLLLCFIIFVNCIISGFFCIPVFALSAGGLQTTIASIILSLFLQTGAAPVNQTFLNTLNTSYGVTSEIGTLQNALNNGLLTESGGTLIDTGLSSAIESAPAYDALNLESIFTTYADDGLNIASGGQNLAGTAINVGTVGTIGAFAGAATIGVGLGVLMAKVNDYIGNFVKYGFPMTPSTIQQIQNDIPQGYDNCVMYTDHNANNINSQSTSFYFGKGNILYGKVDNYNNNGLYAIVAHDFNDSSQSLYRKEFINSTLTWQGNSDFLNPNTTKIIREENRRPILLTNAKSYSSKEEFDNLVSDIENSIVPFPEIYSPDIIGTNGNMKPDELQSMVPDGYDMKPVDIDDYQDYAGLANENTDNENVEQPIQGENFDNLIDSLLVEPSIIPDQGVTDPEVPDRPIIPDQPLVPGKDPITGEQQSEVLQGITTPDLRSVFPFCIPFDLYNIFGVLKYEGREAPVIVWNFEILGNSYPVIIDLSPYEEVASLLRLLELLAFIVGLAVATRRLIGAGG